MFGLDRGQKINQNAKGRTTKSQKSWKKKVNMRSIKKVNEGAGKLKSMERMLHVIGKCQLYSRELCTT